MIVVNMLESHRLLTFVGALLLVVTFLINNNYVEENNVVIDNDTSVVNDAIDDDVFGAAIFNNNGGEFNYAYVTGIAMIGTFVASFVLFTKNKAKRGFAS